MILQPLTHFVTVFCVVHDMIDVEESENITVVNDTVETVIEYDDEEVEKEEDDVIIDPNLVQIRATPAELNHRISAFIERKRQQVNIVNVQEFCCQRLVNKTFTKKHVIVSDLR